MTRVHSHSPATNARPHCPPQVFRSVVYRLAGLLVLAASAGCLDTLPGKPNPADRYRRPETILDFTTLYRTRCSGCHGAVGQHGPAPPLNDPLLLAICADSDLTQAVTNGRPGTPMPAFGREQGGPLTDDQIAALVAGIRKRWGGSAATLESPLPEYRVSHPAGDARAAGDPDAGLLTFARVCATCHGTDGAGGDTAGALNDQAFLATISDQALRRLVITGRPDLGMPNYRDVGESSESPAPLTSQDIADLVALLASWRSQSATGDH